jgi:type IV pilus assembly protein PilY1
LAGVNLALLRYNPRRSYFESGDDKVYRGGYLSTPMLNVDDATNKQTLINIINNYPAGGGTPLTEAVDEAVRFLSGESVNYGRTKRRKNRSWTYLSHSSTHSSGKYISPIKEMCQKNHVVLFTDGASSFDAESNTRIRNLLASMPNQSDIPAELSTSCSSPDGGDSNTRTESCLEELAYYMYNSDHSGKEGIQRIKLHTIGGFISGGAQTILNKAAYHGGQGVAASASNYEELKEALTKIFDSISDSAGSFASPSLAVSTFNSLQQLDHLYYAQFKPAENSSWSGNLKRYRMGAGGVVLDANDKPVLVTNPLSEDYGKTDPAAVSFWTLAADAPDGGDVLKGGVASRLTLNRKILTNINGNNLTQSNNRIHESNSALTRSMFNTNLTGDDFIDLLRWARGVDVANSTTTDVPRKTMEDPLHSSPVVVNYGTTTDASEPDSTVFVATNSGYLHAFDTNKNNPVERFAFVPKELLPNIDRYYQGTGLKTYGLDGHITVWHDDTNKDRIVNGTEQAILYVGMRRGGSSYYAIDISNRDAPKLLWQINGKSHPSTTAGFEQLGQTWSKMVKAQVVWQGAKRDVLIFGGGYDPAEDDYLVRTAHTQGNAIYMVDAKTGSLLWSATGSGKGGKFQHASMTSSFVGDVVAIDDTGDGNVELLYAADVGGRIWRFDFDVSQTNPGQYAKGGVIADLGKDASKTENVRFYNTPDVVYTDRAKVYTVTGTGDDAVATPHDKNKGRYQIAIGSGFRAHPLNEDAYDRFYVINDFNVEGPPSTYTPLTRANLAQYDDQGMEGVYGNEPVSKRLNGLYMNLVDQTKGEKVLSKALTLGDNIYFSSYRPNSAASRSGCEADVGNGRSYVISLDMELTTKDRDQPGIPPDPVPTFPKEPKCTDPSCKDDPKGPQPLDGMEPGPKAKGFDPIEKFFWRENE